MASLIPDLNLIRNGANFLGDYVRRGFEVLQSLVPWTKQYIASVYGSVIDWSGSPVLPAEIIPWDQAPTNTTSAAAQFANCIDIYRDGVCQYRDDDSLFFGPGHLLHRGLFKRQTCNDDDTWVHALASSLTIPDECPTSPGTTSNLDADTWYYVYWKLDAAGEGPEYRISKVEPVICPGYGPEHPVYEKLRFVGSFRTMAAPDAFIRPFTRMAGGLVLWRDIVVGPEAPDFDLITAPSVGYEPLPNVEDWVPPTAQHAIFTYDAQGGGTPSIRAEGDTAVTSGYTWDEGSETTNAILAVCATDAATGMPRTPAGIEFDTLDAGDTCAVVGYKEALGNG